MIRDIAKIKLISSAIVNGRYVLFFIYSHVITVSFMKDNAKKDLIGPGATKFATTFLPLNSMREERKELKECLRVKDGYIFLKRIWGRRYNL